MSSRTLRVGADRTVRFHDTGGSASALTVIWHHGTPQTGQIIEPLAAAAAERNIRMVSCARPSYPGSSPLPGRTVADSAADAIRVADFLGIDQFAAMAASGGGPHAIACAALAPNRVVAVATLAGIAPYTRDFDWFAGMASPGGLRAALAGRAERARYAAVDEFDETSFTDRDWAALAGSWSALGADAQEGSAGGPDGQIDDDVAYIAPWGVSLAGVAAPVLVVQGGRDRVVPATHGRWLAGQLPGAEFLFRPDDGHISILAEVPAALEWLLRSARESR